MDPPKPALTFWNRIEPRPSTNDFVSSLRAEIHDPVWMLARQRQMGEFKGEDTGSPAYVRLSVATAKGVGKWMYTPPGATNAVEVLFADDKPMEPQLLAEPLSPDLATRAELGQTFMDLIDVFVKDSGHAQKIRTAFENAAKDGGVYRLNAPSVDAADFNPLDAGTRQFLAVVGGRSPDGFLILTEKTLPSGITNDLIDNVNTLFDAFSSWATAVYGPNFGQTDPAAWDPARLDYTLSVKVGDAASTTLKAIPDGQSSFSWSSFDLLTDADPFTAPQLVTKTLVPAHIRFPGMPAPRFWDFEDGSLPMGDVHTQQSELAKLMLVDVAIVGGIDWFVVPYSQPLGQLARVKSLVVRDVFGQQTLVERAEKGNTAPGPARWTMFTLTEPGVSVADFAILPPAAGRLRQVGPTLEEVRFARDQMANMVWAIEGTTESVLGEPRSGSARDAAVQAETPTPEPPPTTATLQYQIESKVRVDWIPFLQQPSKKLAAPAHDLEKAAVARKNEGVLLGVPSIGRVLTPSSTPGQPYRIPEQEVPRAGITIRRTVYRSRWLKGETILWVERRRITGTGETQSGLRFDGALAGSKP